MFLKRLEISGFKSFAQKSIIDFDNQKSITSIVGPNGSGKSNVADAVRWVLGEQSYKTIRSKKSEDIIFSGSKGKGRASGARVSMLLDNSDGRAPIDFVEVEIERSVYRDGSSEYLINGKKVRLFDVAELLARSGFGQSTYSVIGQGMVDTMLFYGPSERKVLFDEAAGVRQYELKREQTIRRLADTAQNVVRIKDILYELSPRLKSLKKQAEKAKQKDQIAKDLLEKQKIYFTSIWERLSHAEDGKRKELGSILSEEDSIKKELRDLNKEFELALGQERSDSSSLGEARIKINKLEEQKEKIRQEIYTKKAQLQMQYPDAHSKEVLENKIFAIEEQIKSLDLEKKIQSRDLLQKKISSAGFEAIKKNISDLQVKRSELKEYFYTLKARLDFFGSSVALTKDQINEKINSLNFELNNLGLAKKRKEQLGLQEKIDKINKDLEKNRTKIENSRSQLSSLKNELEGFDFGVVGERLREILKAQNIFINNIGMIKDIAETKKLFQEGESISKKLENLAEKVGDAQKGVLSGISDVQLDIEGLSAEREDLIDSQSKIKAIFVEKSHTISSLVRRKEEIEASIKELKALNPVSGSDKLATEKEFKKTNKELEEIEISIQEMLEKVKEEDFLRKDLLGLNYAIDLEKHKKDELEKSLEKIKSIKPIESEKRTALEKEISALEKEVEEINLRVAGFRKTLEDDLNNFSVIGKRLTEIKEAITSKQSLLNQYSQEITTIKIDLAKIETKKQDLKEEIRRDVGGEEALASVKGILEIDEASFRLEVEKLKNKLYSIGEIDSDVESEYKEVAERVGYLESQVIDLEKAKEDLEKLIKELDKRIKKQFEVSFEKISEKFRHFFELLFDGGEAKLELVVQKCSGDDFSEKTGEQKREDRLGIEITAVPPGKRVKSLSALSGGERTLTSLALLFAILSVNPAPFVVLDEVDAALDESNTKRFIKIVHELSKNTQFIFITHNRETMKEADVIYGVTMDDTHASKLLSIKLEDAKSIKK